MFLKQLQARTKFTDSCVTREPCGPPVRDKLSISSHRLCQLLLIDAQYWHSDEGAWEEVAASRLVRFETVVRRVGRGEQSLFGGLPVRSHVLLPKPVTLIFVRESNKSKLQTRASIEKTMYFAKCRFVKHMHGSCVTGLVQHQLQQNSIRYWLQFGSDDH